MPLGSSSVRVLSSACLAENFTVADVIEMVQDGYLAAARGALVERPRDQPGGRARALPASRTPPPEPAG